MSSIDLRKIGQDQKGPTMEVGHKPYQLFTSLCLLVTDACAGRRHVSLQLDEPLPEIADLVLHIFAFLGWRRQRDHGAILLWRTS